MSGEHAQAFWVREPGRGEIRHQAIAQAAPDHVLVRTLYSGISRGSEALVFHGRVPASEYTRMRAPFQEGDFPAPVKYGYASVGRVAEGPASLLGRDVFCLYPHQDCYRVPAHSVVPLPASVPPPRAVLAANTESALNALWDAPPRIGDRVAVVGAGALGCLVARLAARVPQVSVQLVDVNPARAAVAAALGVDFAHPDAARGDADLVVHTSASGAGLDTALNLAGFEATVLELSWYGTAAAHVHLGGAFHARRLRVISSQVGAVAAARRAQRTHRERLALAVALLADDALDALITGEDAFADLPAVMARLAGDGADTICHRIRYA
jgi:threonine dehydrogenase-like Zn-dependent dehydrogenase